MNNDFLAPSSLLKEMERLQKGGDNIFSRNNNNSNNNINELNELNELNEQIRLKDNLIEQLTDSLNMLAYNMDLLTQQQIENNRINEEKTEIALKSLEGEDRKKYLKKDQQALALREKRSEIVSSMKEQVQNDRKIAGNVIENKIDSTTKRIEQLEQMVNRLKID